MKRLFFLLFSYVMIHVAFVNELAYADQAKLMMHTSTSSMSKPNLDVAQRTWLKTRKQLRVGIFKSDNPPYDIFSPTLDYQGLSADYLGLIGRQLALPVDITTFNDRESLWQALRSGDIDLIPSIASESHNGIVNTQSYTSEKPILAVKSTDRAALPEHLEQTRIATVRDYLTLPELKSAYPEAIFQIYDTNQEALSAVAFGNARVFLGSGYALGQNFINSLRVDKFANLPKRESTFAVSINNQQLASIINVALQSIPQEKNAEVKQLWEAGYSSVMMQQLPLTNEEEEWIKKHQNVNVIVYGKDFSAPMAFVDNSGVIRGIAADILSIVGLKTGLSFQFYVTDDFRNLMEDTLDDKAQMIASIAYSAKRNNDLLLSYPFTRTPYTLLTNYNDHSISQLSDLRGKKLGMIKGAALAKEIFLKYPEITIIFYNTDTDLLNAVANRDVDAITGFLVTADYQVNNNYRDKVRIANTLDDKSAYISFGVGRKNSELQSILNKVMLTIPPYELDMFARRWGTNHLITVDSFWSQNRKIILLSIIGVLILLLIAVGRAILLRRKIALAEQATHQLARQSSMLEKLVDTMPFPIKLRDLEGKLTYCNQLALEFFNQPFEAIKGKTIIEAASHLTPEMAQLIYDKHREAVKYNKTFHQYLDLTLTNQPDGIAKSVTSSVWILPWRDADEQIVGSIFALWDVSDREELVRQLKDASDRAESSNRAKSTFLSTMSHEIRTPMNAIIGMLDMAIKKGRKGEHDLEALEVAHDSANGLVGLIGDILDLSRIEGGHIEFRPSRINLGSLLDQLLVIFNGMAIDKNITLRKTFPNDIIDDVIGDPLRIKQVLSNILNNAIKFTDSGGVSINLEQEKLSHGQVQYKIVVKDSGIGIAPDQQTALFKPFSQADNRRAGTGLGLYISRKLCHSMNGDLTLESEQFVGTTLTATFMLPLAEREPIYTVEVDENRLSIRALNVLVVDDNEANRILLAKQLAWLGHHAHVAKDGFEGMEIWESHTFDAIITDCNMPGMNGYQFTQRIRETELRRGIARNWIIGFTANAMPEIIERCLNAGMDSCLFKPCSISSLEQALGNLKNSQQ